MHTSIKHNDRKNDNKNANITMKRKKRLWFYATFF